MHIRLDDLDTNNTHKHALSLAISFSPSLSLGRDGHLIAMCGKEVILHSNIKM